MLEWGLFYKQLLERVLQWSDIVASKLLINIIK